jgi:hypothetical protein
MTFDVEARRVYLNELRTHGQRGLAAEAAGVHLNTIAAYKKNEDSEGTFAAAEKLCIQLRSEMIVRKLEQEFIDGVLEPKIDKNGDLVYWNKPTGQVDENGNEITVRLAVFTRKLESAARLRVLERHDPAYREHKEVDVNTKTSGVLVVPAVKESVGDWEEQIRKAKEQAPE